MVAPPWSGRRRKCRPARPRSPAARHRDRGRIDRPAAMGHLALGQQMALEDDVDRLQIEFGGHVADGAIFVVEILGRIRLFIVAVDEVAEHLPMADEMVAEVHRHEAGELKEARIDPPPRARIEIGHGHDHVLLEPGERALGGDRVDLGRRLARVDRPAHHGQRLRPAADPCRRSSGRRRRRPDRRLADGEHMRARARSIASMNSIR